jgi:mannose-6-phosphate isomerase-like protein (cupin superfamily)
MTPGQWEPKVWGSVCHLFTADHVAVSHLRVNVGYRCSQHYHDDRVNMFVIVSGKVLIEVTEANVKRSHILVAGETLIVSNRCVHCFHVLESGSMIEVYWTDNGSPVRLDDIIRLDEGGNSIYAEDFK